jgi:hypothetical protein
MGGRYVVAVAVCCVFGSGFLAGTACGDTQTRGEGISFNRDIRPILSDKCLACHGQDPNTREADLRLDTFEGATADLGGTQAVVPGDLDSSQLWARVTSDDEYEVMPPPDSHKSLSDAEKALLKQWILEGAPYENHWAFEPIRRPARAARRRRRASGRRVACRGDSRRRADRSAAADRETLIRRVAFALTGLPPTIDEIDAYLADEHRTRTSGWWTATWRRRTTARKWPVIGWTSPATPTPTVCTWIMNDKCGPIAIGWSRRSTRICRSTSSPSGRWRAICLPDPTTEQLVATGFNRCNVTTSEGGAIDAEFTYRYAVERTSTVAQAWLGLTAGCAVCHDHKYDPLSTREFYSLYAFFNNAADPAMDGNVNTTPPLLKLPTAAQRAAAESAAAAEQAGLDWSALARVRDRLSGPGAGGGNAAGPIVEVLFDETFPPGSSTRSSSRNAIVWVLDPPHSAASGRRVIRQAHADCRTRSSSSCVR